MNSVRSIGRLAVVLLSFAVGLPGQTTVGTASDPPIHTTDETQYLVFGVTSDVFGADPGAVFGLLDAEVAGFVDRIGQVGDGKFRRLGFFLVLPAWILDKVYSEKVPVVVREAFRVARNRGVAVYFAIESHYFWQTRPDLWNCFDPSGPGYDPENRNNVEWSDWKGTPYPARFLDWGTPQMLPPHMCYSCPKIRSEVERLVAQVLGPPIRASLDELAASGLDGLFAGVTVTSEPSVDNYEVVDALDAALGQFMDQFHAPKVRLGYNALTQAGYSEAHPPADIQDALGEVNRQLAALWAKQLVGAGLPASKLYTHVAASAGVAGWPGLDFTNAPLAAAFNDFSRPGWTTYPVGPLAQDFGPIYDELDRHGSPHWGGTEASPISASGLPPYQYLRRHFDHGATVVAMNTGASSANLTRQLTDAVWGPNAIAAYRRFFSEAGEAPQRPAVVPVPRRGAPHRLAPRPAR